MGEIKMVERILDIETIARIGLMFLDGDALRDVLVDPLTGDDDDTDYNAGHFNALKKALMKIERFDPDRYITGLLWQWHHINRKLAIPAVAGKALPATGWRAVPCTQELYDCMTKRVPTSRAAGEDRVSYFYPILSSASDVVGALELVDGGKRGLFEERLFTCDPIN